MDKTKAPLFHVTKRVGIPAARAWMIRGCAVLLSLIVCGLITMVVTGENPVAIYLTIFKGSFGSVRKVWVLFQNIAMLLCVSLAVTPAFRMRFWNIGGEGQCLVGGLAAAACMICLRDALPNFLVILCMVVSSLAAGAIWGGIPAIFRAKWNTNETLFTLMMNYVAIQIVAYATNILRGQASSLGTINMGSKIGWFPKLFGYDFTLNILIVAVLTAAMYIYLKYTKHGYEIAVVGESEKTARYAGIDVKKVTIRTLLLSGAICGLCGFIIVAGNKHTISTNTAGGDGFTAIIVAWLAKFTTFPMALISFLLIFLEKGAGQIASTYGLNEYIPDILSGHILFCILGSEFFLNYRMIFRHKEESRENRARDEEKKGGGAA